MIREITESKTEYFCELTKKSLGFFREGEYPEYYDDRKNYFTSKEVVATLPKFFQECREAVVSLLIDWADDIELLNKGIWIVVIYCDNECVVWGHNNNLESVEEATALAKADYIDLEQEGKATYFIIKDGVLVKTIVIQLSIQETLVSL